MDTISKKPRSKARKIISTLAKIFLALMGEPVSTASKQEQSLSKKRSVFLKILFFLLKLPLLVFIGSAKNKKQEDPTLLEISSGEKMHSGRYYVPDDKS